MHKLHSKSWHFCWSWKIVNIKLHMNRIVFIRIKWKFLLVVILWSCSMSGRITCNENLMHQSSCFWFHFLSIIRWAWFHTSPIGLHFAEIHDRNLVVIFWWNNDFGKPVGNHFIFTCSHLFEIFYLSISIETFSLYVLQTLHQFHILFNLIKFFVFLKEWKYCRKWVEICQHFDCNRYDITFFINNYVELSVVYSTFYSIRWRKTLIWFQNKHTT